MISIFAAVVVSACLECHADKMPKFRDDVHAQVGLSCQDCHETHARPKRTGIPDLCGRCHSSAEYMKRFNPAARIDQVAEYRTSVHGQRLAKGDEKVATCIDCHSVHDIRRKSNPDAPVYATHVAETCSRCHAGEYARWKVSVHAHALLEKNDLTAPTCNDCHGNHGAAPPEVKSVSFVCGTCHGREAELFRKSAKFEGWTRHNELLSTGAKCGDCHDDARGKVSINHFTECVTCHENHSVVRPGVAMMGALPEVPCAYCHEGGGPLASLVAEPAKKASHYRELRDTLLAAAARQHLSGDARFDWLVDQARNLPTHKGRPEFARLFDKFRIGKTHYTVNGVSVAVRRCADCHLDVKPARASHELTGMIARAERIQLAAHRGGVETRDARAELDAAVDNHIEMEALVHTFGGPEVRAKEQEGLGHAKAALLHAQRSLDELQYRRTGLFIALGVIVAVLVALAVKIRTLG